MIQWDSLWLLTLDKAKVENADLLAERWIIAALRHRKFYALAASVSAGEAESPAFRKRESSRASLFAALDRPALQPLPVERASLRPSSLNPFILTR